MSIERTNPITGTEVQRRWLQANAATIEAAEEGASIGAQELHTSVDGAGLKRVFRCHENIGRTYHLGTVANEAAMLALDSPLTSHACLPGDTCFRSDSQQIMRCVSNYGVSVGDWEVVSSSADPAGTAAAAVSAHNTAPDSHADIRTLIDGKQPLLNISPVGTALLNLSTPTAVKIPRVNADGSATLIDVPSAGGVEVDADFVSISYNPSGAGASRGLYSGIMSETVPSQASTGFSTWVNQGGATVTDASVGIQIINPTTGPNDNIRGLVMPVPATPYALTALLELASIAGNYPSALLGWADYASTKTHLVILCGDGRSGLISPTSYTSWALSGAPTFTRDGRRAWLQFADDGTTITVKWSFSGVYWCTLYSATKASSHLGAEGYNRLFFGASSGNITGVATLLSWSIS